MEDPRAFAVINEVLPGVADRLKANPLSHNMTMALMTKVPGGMISGEALQHLDARLREL